MHRSALPLRYYAVFGVYEPVLSIVSSLGALANPKQAYTMQATWPNGPPETIEDAALVTMAQLSHVCALLGFIGAVFMSAARRYLNHQPALQEKIVGSYLLPLIIGDITHVAVTFWGLGDQRYNFREWGTITWVVFSTAGSLFIPRLCWMAGLGRYVATRDGLGESQNEQLEKQKQ